MYHVANKLRLQQGLCPTAPTDDREEEKCGTPLCGYQQCLTSVQLHWNIEIYLEILLDINVNLVEI